jgi:hypothetical protein
LKIAIADLEEVKLKEVGKKLAKMFGEGNVMVVPTNVAKVEEVVKLRDKVYEAWGEVRIIASRSLSANRGLHSIILFPFPTPTLP